jgi:hypothetical protein
MLCCFHDGGRRHLGLRTIPFSSSHMHSLKGCGFSDKTCSLPASNCGKGTSLNQNESFESSTVMIGRAVRQCFESRKTKKARKSHRRLTSHPHAGTQPITLSQWNLLCGLILTTQSPVPILVLISWMVLVRRGSKLTLTYRIAIRPIQHATRYRADMWFPFDDYYWRWAPSWDYVLWLQRKFIFWWEGEYSIVVQNLVSRSSRSSCTAS